MSNFDNRLVKIEQSLNYYTPVEWVVELVDTDGSIETVVFTGTHEQWLDSLEQEQLCE